MRTSGTPLKEHLWVLSTMIPSTYRSSHGPWNWRILLLRPKFFMCKDVWIQWVQQKNYPYSSHIGENFWPANEICHFSYATKLKTTCSFFTRFSSCMFIHDSIFQMNFNFTINMFPIWKIIKFWLICTTGAAKATGHFLAKSGVWK